MMEIYTDENCTNTTSNVMSNASSENELPNNGAQGTVIISHGTISISDSVIAQNSVLSVKKERVDSNQTNIYTTLDKIYLPATLMILMCMIVIILQIPTVLYYTDPSSAESMLFDSINLETCSIDNLDLLQSSFSTSLKLLCNNSNNSSHCNKTELEILQPVYHFSTILGNDQCNDAILRLYCKTINVIYNDKYALINECFKVRDEKCAAEWRIAENFLNFSLPDCSSFDLDGNFVTARAPILECPDDFGVFCGSICQPLCDELSLFNDAATVAYEVLNIVLHTLSLIGGIITFLACCLRKRKMFSFPLVFVVYNTITFEIISFFLLLPYIFGSDNLLCSHSNLIVSNANPTAFCQIQGLVIQSGALIFFGFWLFHLFHLLFSLMYPFKAQTLMKSTSLRRNLHIAEVAITLLCGLLPSIIIIGTSGYQNFAFPPVCTNEIPEVLFYTFIFPMSLGSTIGLSMLLLSIVILRKHHYTERTKTLRKRPSMREMIFNSYSIPETKLIILFSYYGMTTILVLIYLTVTYRSRDTIIENVTNFTLCTAGGYRVECDRYRENLNSNLIPAFVFDVISTLFLSCVNILNLLYVLQYKDVKEALKKVFPSISNAESS